MFLVNRLGDQPVLVARDISGWPIVRQIEYEGDVGLRLLLAQIPQDGAAHIFGE